MNALRRFLAEHSDVFTEPLRPVDVTALVGMAFGMVGYLAGDAGHWSHWGMFAAGACFGQLIAYRSHRAHDRKMTEIYSSAMRTYVAEVNRLFSQRRD